MMTDSNESFDLPRWQTHIDPLSSTAQAAHAAQASYYGSSAPPPPPSAHQSGASPVSPLRMNPPPNSAVRQPRISQLLEQDQPANPSYLSSGPQSLSRSASLNSAVGGNSSSRARRHHQPEDLESPYRMDSSGNSYYHTANHSSSAYQTPSLSTSNSTSPPTAADPYSDMYYARSGNVDSSDRPPQSSRSPMRMAQTPTSGNALDPYSHQSPYSPPGQAANYSSNASSYSPSAGPPYSFGSPEQRPTYAHSRNHSQQMIKTEAMSPSLASTYSPQGPMPPPAGYSSSYENSAPSHTQQLAAQHSSRKTASNPPTPLSYLPSPSPSNYYTQDHAMAVDSPPKRRAAGFRRVRGSQDLQPRAEVPNTGRRMSGDGSYLSVRVHEFLDLVEFAADAPFLASATVDNKHPRYLSDLQPTV